MGKHQKHKKHGTPQPDGREMYQCEICKKRFPFKGYLPSPLSTPFMFLVVADPKHRRFSLAVCMPDMHKTETEVALWFVCSDRQCIFKSFLLWREWDKRVLMEAASMEQIEQVLKMVKSKGATALEQDLDEILEHGIIQRGRSLFGSEQPDEAAVPESPLQTPE